jgi:hypothetical protein
MTVTAEEVAQDASDVRESTRQIYSQVVVDRQLQSMGSLDQLEARIEQVTKEFARIALAVLRTNDHDRQSALLGLWKAGVVHVENHSYLREVIRRDRRDIPAMISAMPSFVARVAEVEQVVEKSMTLLAADMFRPARDKGSTEAVYAVLATLRPEKTNDRFAELAERSRDELNAQEVFELNILQDFFTHLQSVIDAALDMLYVPSP